MCLDFSHREKNEREKSLCHQKSIITFDRRAPHEKNGIWDLNLNLAMRRAFLTLFREFKTSITTPVKSNWICVKRRIKFRLKYFMQTFSRTPRCLSMIKEHQVISLIWVGGSKLIENDEDTEFKGKIPMRWSLSIRTADFCFGHFASTTKNYEVIPHLILVISFPRRGVCIFVWTLRNLRIQLNIKFNSFLHNLHKISFKLMVS